LRPSATNSRSLDVHARLAAAPFRSPGPNPSSSGWGLPRRTTLPRFGEPCGPPSKPGKMYLASLCNRSTTRAPTDRSIPGYLAYAELTAGRIDTCSERPRGVPLPCGNRTPGGRVLDGTCPTSAKPTTTLPNGKSRAPHRAMPPRRSVFNRVQGCSIWPLAPLVLPRRGRSPEPREAARALLFAPAPTGATFQTRSAFHQQVVPKEPAPVLAA
jgi:hypothetical protein